jgi:ABC-type bacteriocin/lantibiotic exporter with double-glycine peptidase domain
MTASRRVPPGAIRVQLPCVVQRKDHTCGAAAILAVSRYHGVGPATEREVVRDMGFGRDGSDPAHLLRALRRYRLNHAEHRGMTDAELRARLDRRQPVIMMLQAWGDVHSYRHAWLDGHWIVAIGYDACGIYVEDPVIERARGFLSWSALAERWHDIEGRTRRRVHRYGLAVWGSRARVGQPAIHSDAIINVA